MKATQGRHTHMHTHTHTYTNIYTMRALKVCKACASSCVNPACVDGLIAPPQLMTAASAQQDMHACIHASKARTHTLGKRGIDSCSDCACLCRLVRSRMSPSQALVCVLPFPCSLTDMLLLLAVTCMISQNTGGATHTAHTCFWDAETDGALSCS
jgi:hypothetical protein